MKRQSEREGEQFLILSPGEGSAAALSALPSEVSLVGKDSALSDEKQGIKEESSVKSSGSAISEGKAKAAEFVKTVARLAR